MTRNIRKILKTVLHHIPLNFDRNPRNKNKKQTLFAHRKQFAAISKISIHESKLNSRAGSRRTPHLGTSAAAAAAEGCVSSSLQKFMDGLQSEKCGRLLFRTLIHHGGITDLQLTTLAIYNSLFLSLPPQDLPLSQIFPTR